MEVLVPKSEGTIACNWPDTPDRERRCAVLNIFPAYPTSCRVSFCQQYEGYGRACRCDDPDPITHTPAHIYTWVCFGRVGFVSTALCYKHLIYFRWQELLGKKNSVVDTPVRICTWYHWQLTRFSAAQHTGERPCCCHCSQSAAVPLSLPPVNTINTGM